MKLKISSRSPFIFNVLGVGNFFIFLIFYIFLLYPFFYVANYFVFSFVLNDIKKYEGRNAFFLKIPDGDLKKNLFQMNALNKVQFDDVEYLNEEKKILHNNEINPLFFLMEKTKNVSFSELNINEQPLSIYYQSYVISFNKENNSLYLKENSSLVYDSLDKVFDNNSIDSVKMNMDKINYDFQLELERWYGRFIQNNRKIISQIIYFINSSRLPEILKKDVTSMFGNDLIILDSEVYLKELIGVLENIKGESNETLYCNEIAFLQKKYAELYKIRSKSDVNGIKVSIYDFFKADKVFISDNLQLVLARDILIEKELISQLNMNEIDLKKVGNNFLLINKDCDIRLFSGTGELLKASKYLFNFYLCSIGVLVFIFCISFFRKKVFVVLLISILIFILLFGRCFFIEAFLVALYSILFRRYRLK